MPSGWPRPQAPQQAERRAAAPCTSRARRSRARRGAAADRRARTGSCARRSAGTGPRRGAAFSADRSAPDSSVVVRLKYWLDRSRWLKSKTSTGTAVSDHEQQRPAPRAARRPQPARVEQRRAEQEERHEQLGRPVGVEAEREQRPGRQQPARPAAHAGGQRGEGEQEDGREGDELEGDAAEVHVPGHDGEQQRRDQAAGGAERRAARAGRCRARRRCRTAPRSGGR